MRSEKTNFDLVFSAELGFNLDFGLAWTNLKLQTGPVLFRTSGRENKPVFALRSFRPVNIPFVVFSRSHAPLVLFNGIFNLSKTSSRVENFHSTPG